MNSERRENKLKAVAFQLFVIRNPNARYRLIRSGLTYLDFFTLNDSTLRQFGFNAAEIKNVKQNYHKIAERELSLASGHSIKVISQDEEEYPGLLKEIFDPPLILYVLGDESVLNRENSLAVVGSRKGNSYGRTVLDILIPPLSEEGISVISGMAYGIDSMAHRVAIRSGGKTIGVNAGGLLNLYPAKNRALFKKISGSGCVVSEYPLNTVPRPFLFPIRNRIIAGLSRGILVVQAEMRSGSLITARLGVEQNREVMAVPGPITDRLSAGTNYLVRQGAAPVLSACDILEEFGVSGQRKTNPSINDFSSVEKIILDLIAVNEVKRIDYFVEKSGLSVPEVITILMGLVLKNVVIEELGGYRRVL